MLRSLLLLALAGTLVLGGLALSPETSNAAVVSAGADSDLVATLGLGCTVSIRATNTGSRDIEVDLTNSKVRTRTGTWKRIDKVAGAIRGACTDDEITVENDGDTYSESCNLDLGCNTRRRYKFVVERRGSRETVYYPSARDWTRDVRIDLGNLNRHF
ncbi:MAG: hypothetical protein AAGI52_11955 [Bacteroidota bacterium]